MGVTDVDMTPSSLVDGRYFDDEPAVPEPGSGPPIDIDAMAPGGDSRRVVLTPASAIRPRRVRWLWERRVAIGTIALLAGREGLGKSTVAYWLAARITRGELAGEYAGQPKSVLVCATEDSWEYTIVPRLIAAGADRARVYRVDVLTAEDICVGLSLPRDLHQVEQAAMGADAVMLLLDPLMSRLAASLDSHRDAEVRQALEPLAALADRAGMAVLGLMHHNKSASTDPLQLVMGSRAFTAVARSVHTVVPDPDDETQRLFGTPKNNLGRTDLPVLAFGLVAETVGTDDGPMQVGAVRWGTELTGSISDAMSRAAQTDEERSAVAEAGAWLADYLASVGGSAASADIRRAGGREGHSYDALKRARRKQGIECMSEGFPRRTLWCLPGGEPLPEEGGGTVGANPTTQSEQQSEQPVRGECTAALTDSSVLPLCQSEQWEQSEQLSRDGAPTSAADCSEARG